MKTGMGENGKPLLLGDLEDFKGAEENYGKAIKLKEELKDQGGLKELYANYLNVLILALDCVLIGGITHILPEPLSLDLAIIPQFGVSPSRIFQIYIIL